MVCTANDLLEWKDFPKGLRVLVLDEDNDSAIEIKSKLEDMDYIVSTFCNENDALNAISNKSESFHVALVEVSTGNNLGSFKFLETAKELPTIMISSIHCLSTTMRCIALGAAEFLHKPLSEEKLRNIWQHVVHKAFNAGESSLSCSLKPVKETVSSILQLEVEKNENKNQNLIETKNLANDDEFNHEQTTVLDKFPAPSDQPSKQCGRSLDNDGFRVEPNCSLEKDPINEDGEPKSVETSSKISVEKGTTKIDNSIKDENSPCGSNTENNLRAQPQMSSRVESRNPKKASALHQNSNVSRANRKKMKVDWTTDLHKRFVQAVEQLGVDQAIPSRILELMKVEGLTRHNVASHLQKYRLNKRHILPKEEDRRWQQTRDNRHSLQRSNYQYKPIMAYPSYHPPSHPIYPVWGQPSSHSLTGQMWGHPSIPAWQQPSESWQWKTYTGMHMDAWGCPVMPASQNPNFTFPQVQMNASGFHNLLNTVLEDSSGMDINKASFESNHLEVIDRVVKEAINKPWLPLPLGLKPPSTESVLFELQRQGISNIPPQNPNLTWH